MQRPLKILSVVVVLLVALILIGRSLRPAMPALDRSRFISLGHRLAEETSRTIQGKGQVVAVLEGAAFGDVHSPLHDQWKSFQQELARQSGISLAPPEVLPPDPNDIIPGAGSSRHQLKETLAKHAAADAIVFFFALPDWSLVAPQLPAHVTAKILVADNQAGAAKRRYENYFGNGFLSVLILAWSEKATGDGFAQNYTVFTSENYRSLPE
ncbi:MAG: hypothetical protein PCFJNLEI_00959 [Verrucomicrobiae bacterium]|nr:hypothetical protein [Verrucomicrobiae bacterium]